MNIESNITASIVIYKEDISVLQKAIDSFLESPLSKKLFLIDNSPNQNIQSHISNAKIEYLYSGENLGFGKGHNQSLQWLQNEESGFHLILNPDVVFNPDILVQLTSELNKDAQLSMIAPKTMFPDNSLQYTARKFPRFRELVFRFLNISNGLTTSQEYRDQDLNTFFYPDFVHGSFMLFKTKDLLALKGFDERFFMYMEDVDICRRIDVLGKKKMYFPSVSITHELRKGSGKNMKLFFIHMSSMIKYYKKWGL